MKLFVWRVALDGRIPGLILSMAESLEDAKRVVLDTAIEWEKPLLSREMTAKPEVHDSAMGLCVWGAH